MKNLLARYLILFFAATTVNAMKLSPEDEARIAQLARRIANIESCAGGFVLDDSSYNTNDMFVNRTSLLSLK